MFTVKQIINNATSLYEAKEITVARPGSEQWRQAFALADELDVMAPDIIEHIPMSYEDQDMTKPVGDEHQLTVERTGANRADCIAIICSGIPLIVFTRKARLSQKLERRFRKRPKRWRCLIPAQSRRAKALQQAFAECL